MPIKAMCPECETQYSVPDSAAGKKVKCQSCELVFPIPATKKAARPKAPERETEDDLPLLTPARKPLPSGGLPPKIVKPKKSTYHESDDDDDDAAPRKKPRQERSFDEPDARLMILAIVLGVVALGAVAFFAVRLRQGENALVRAIADDGEPDIVDLEDPADLPQIRAARPFADAIAAGNLEAAFAELSPLARANAYRDQFVPPGDDEQERKSVAPLTLESFKELMAESAKVLGTPKKLEYMYVNSRDREVLSGRGDAIDRLITLGGTPEGVSASARRASVHVTVNVRHPDVADADIEEGEEPYLNMRIIVTEEDGKLGVGYFELSPPSILD